MVAPNEPSPRPHRLGGQGIPHHGGSGRSASDPAQPSDLDLFPSLSANWVAWVAVGALAVGLLTGMALWRHRREQEEEQAAIEESMQYQPTWMGDEI